MQRSLGATQFSHIALCLHGYTTTVAFRRLQTLHLKESLSFSFSSSNLALSSPEKNNNNNQTLSSADPEPPPPLKNQAIARCHHRPTSKTPLKWRFDGGPMVARLEYWYGFLFPVKFRLSGSAPDSTFGFVT